MVTIFTSYSLPQVFKNAEGILKKLRKYSDHTCVKFDDDESSVGFKEHTVTMIVIQPVRKGKTRTLSRCCGHSGTSPSRKRKYYEKRIHQ